METKAISFVIDAIGLDSIYISKKNARGNPDKKSIQELADNMAGGVGLIHPICVEQQGDEYELLAGKRRFLAAKKLHWKKIDAKIYRGLTDERRVTIIAAENMMRTDLTLLEQVKQIEYLTAKKLNAQAVAEAMGKSVGWVLARRKLKSLTDDWREALTQPQFTALTLDNWISIATLPPDRQVELFIALDGDDGDLDPTEIIKWDRIAAEIQEQNKLLKNAPWPLNWICGDRPKCTKCAERTGATPDLFFGDVVLSKDRCLNPLCWVEKYNAYSEKKAAELRAAYPDALWETQSYKFAGGKTIPSELLKKTTAAEPESEDAVPVFTRAGDTAWVKKAEYEAAMEAAGKEPEKKAKTFRAVVDESAMKMADAAYRDLGEALEDLEALEEIVDVEVLIWLITHIGMDPEILRFVSSQPLADRLPGIVAEIHTLKNGAETMEMLLESGVVGFGAKLLQAGCYKRPAHQSIWLLMRYAEFIGLSSARAAGYISNQLLKAPVNMWSKRSDFDQEYWDNVMLDFKNPEKTLFCEEASND